MFKNPEPPGAVRYRFRYWDIFSLASSTVPSLQVFRLNGPYDPDYTGGGKQPYGWD
jgi:hypothetical protein